MADDHELPRDDHSLEERGAALLGPSRGGQQTIPRVVSLLVLIAVLLLTAVLFFRVMALFVVPLFLAGVLVVVFQPLFRWMCQKMPGRLALPAFATTAAILLLVLVPFTLIGWTAFIESAQVAATAQEELKQIISLLENQAPGAGEASPEMQEEAARAQKARSWYKTITNRELDKAEFEEIQARLTSVAARRVLPVGLSGVQAIATFAIGLAVMTVSVYYFFADGPAMVKTLMHLSPLDDQYEAELLNRFSEVSRAVVLATVLSALAQGLLSGAGYWFALEAGSPIFLLTVTTMLFAMVPFVGATAVWLPVSLWLVFIQGDVFAGVALAVYGALIVSTIDNVIKPLVLHGQSNLHPLLALLSVLGGVMVLGPIGVLVGPMLVTFLQALLVMLRKELDSIGEDAGLTAADKGAGHAGQEAGESDALRNHDGEPQDRQAETMSARSDAPEPDGPEGKTPEAAD